MSDTGKRKRSRRRSRAYRQAGMIINLSFFIIIILFTIIGAFHVFTHKRSYRNEGVELYNKQEYAAAIDKFDKALDCRQWFADKLNVDICLYKADCYIRLYDYSAAADVYSYITSEYSKRYYEEDEVNFLIKLCDAMESFNKGDYSSPLPYLTEAVEQGYTEMCVYVAYCYEQQENYDKMTAYYDKYIEKLGITSYIAFKYADYYIYAERYGDAITYAEQGLLAADNEYEKQLKYLQIIAYKGQGNYTDAYSLAASYNAAYPDDEKGTDILAYLETRVNPDTTFVNNIYNVNTQQ